MNLFFNLMFEKITLLAMQLGVRVMESHVYQHHCNYLSTFVFGVQHTKEKKG